MSALEDAYQEAEFVHVTWQRGLERVVKMREYMSWPTRVLVGTRVKFITQREAIPILLRIRNGAIE